MRPRIEAVVRHVGTDKGDARMDYTPDPLLPPPAYARPLGLRAVKQGFANNRGTALAGTIISYVFTILVLVLVALLLLVAKAKPTFPHLEA